MNNKVACFSMKDEREAVKSKLPGQMSFCELIRRHRDPRGHGGSELRHRPSLSGDAQRKETKQYKNCQSSVWSVYI